ncbi:MAG TPA: alpha/beta hydrolase [Streptosporangiaceae bacterium]|nr:alpha/beta hydrolase [Streptosporangiaceae bacterium]
MSEAKTYTLDVPGAVLSYDVRENEASDEPVLLIIGSPMGASGFATLAGHFGDRTVVTYDPRGADRSRRSDSTAEMTPDQHADDLHRLIEALDVGPVDVFASSGGAVNGLVLVAQHPEQVRTLVAHEPPASQEVPDHEAVTAACADIRETYLSSGFGPAMAKFIKLVMFEGPLPADYTSQPAPDPAMFGLPTADDGSRDDPLMANMITCNGYHHDFGALKAAATRVIVGVGTTSSQQLAGRAGTAVAERLGIEPVTFPGGHDGFSGGEYGGPGGEPDGFAATLHKVLAG